MDECVHRFDRATVEQTLDSLKNLDFDYATRAGVTIGVVASASAPRWC